MGSKLCSKFRKFKRKVLGKKEKYDRLEEEGKDESPPGEIANVPAVKEHEKPAEKQSELRLEKSYNLNEENAENTQNNTKTEDLETYIFTLEEELKNCFSGTTIEREEICGNLGAACYRTCDFQKSKKYYEMYFKSIRKTGSPEQLQRAHCNLGCVYRRLGDFNTAEEHFKQGLEISEQLGDKKSKGRLLNNLGNICEMRKDFDTAIYYHAQRRKVAETLSDWESEAKACASLGNAYQIVGNLRASIVFYERVVIWLKRKYLYEQRHEKRRQSIASSVAASGEEWV